MTPREAFFQRVRQAVIEGNRAGVAPSLPERAAVGYQGAGPDPVARFCEELKNAGGYPHLAPDSDSAWHVIRQLLDTNAARNVLLAQGGMVERLALATRLRQDGFNVTTMDMARGGNPRDVFFGADVGITNVDHLVAETGSVVMATGPDEPRSLSLLPPLHIALADRTQLLPDLFDLFDLFSPISSPGKLPPSCITVITGPSKTGDIELRLVTGVHGPGEIHVVLCTG